ncbi:hypothetical protein [Isachenkonia alkalipeptolytica]|uniref:Uncharacterized protein n=1 Tax=Isachenkonia alkalipeptolytica TaxID=2565777 RepID=A0AA43XNE9_9CLOT|nr:hypothetical protein [Isachenkonia alkalipeptolytica]NBG89524.1 hypothetical protein [Isachenkonia alkalipeptolytica]
MFDKVNIHIKNKTLCGAVMNRVLNSEVKKWLLKLPLPYIVEKKFIPTDYFRVLINPKLIEYVVQNIYKEFVDNPYSFVLEGDWDLYKGYLRGNTLENDRRVIYASMNQIFVEGIHFKECDQYYWMKERILERGHSYWCTSEDDLDKYFENLIKTYEGIKNEGYLSQEELAQKNPELIDKRRISKLDDEIKVYIDRTGNFLLGGGGTHRLLIADLCEIKEIPAIIAGVHKSWLDEVHRKHKSGAVSSIKKELNAKPSYHMS